MEVSSEDSAADRNKLMDMLHRLETDSGGQDGDDDDDDLEQR